FHTSIERNEKKRPKLSPRAFKSTYRGRACSSAARSDGAQTSPQKASVVVGPLAVIDEVETLALLIGARAPADQRPDAREDDRRSDPRPDQRQGHGLGLGDHLRGHVVVADLTGCIVEHAGAAEPGCREEPGADGADDAADAMHAEHVERVVIAHLV